MDGVRPVLPVDSLVLAQLEHRLRGDRRPDRLVLGRSHDGPEVAAGAQVTRIYEPPNISQVSLVEIHVCEHGTGEVRAAQGRSGQLGAGEVHSLHHRT